MHDDQRQRGAREWLSLLSVLLMLGVACGGEPPAAEPEMDMDHEMDAPAADAAPAPTPPRVFFVAPEDGEMYSVDNPVVFEFGVESYDIGVVPEEVEEVRQGMGHYHLGVDTECLPAGVEIPKADPWVHFGDGSNTIEMMLEPGEHTFALQMGDDLHYTIDGLCETVTIRVEEGI